MPLCRIIFHCRIKLTVPLRCRYGTSKKNAIVLQQLLYPYRYAGTGRLVKHNIMAIWGKTLSKQIILSKLIIHLIIFIFLPDFNKYSLVETEGSTTLTPVEADYPTSL